VILSLNLAEQLENAVRQLHGFMRGSVLMPLGFYLTAPMLDEPLLADAGVIYA
jgi:hypothetical protein